MIILMDSVYFLRWVYYNLFRSLKAGYIWVVSNFYYQKGMLVLIVLSWMKIEKRLKFCQPNLDYLQRFYIILKTKKQTLSAL